MDTQFTKMSANLPLMEMYVQKTTNNKINYMRKKESELRQMSCLLYVQMSFQLKHNNI